MQEYDSSYEHRPGTAFSELFMEPLSLIVQPLRDEANIIQTNQSLRRILDEENPDEYFEDSVDDAVENFFVYRRAGSQASTIVRVYYREPQDVEFGTGSLTATSTGGLIFRNSTPIRITSQQMAIQIENEFFYFDAPFGAEGDGEEYNVGAGEIVQVDDPAAAKAENKFEVRDGADREFNTELIDRTRNSIGVRDLNVGKGFNAILFENFLNSLTEIQPIGFRDPEMMRDIVSNYHVGGRIDGYVKTPSIQDGEFNVTGLTIDVTRRLATSSNLLMEGTSFISLGVQNLDITERTVQVEEAEVQSQTAVFYSYVDLENGVDLSVNQYIRLQVDQNNANDIRIAGNTPAETQIGEIINLINLSTQERTASVAVNPVVISRRSTGNIPADLSVYLIDPTPNVFRNVAVGDILYVTFGDNAGSYEIVSVDSENQITINGATPFPKEQVDANYRISRIGTFIKMESQVSSSSSLIELSSPLTGLDALNDAFGLSPGTHPFVGAGPRVFDEGVDFEVDLTNGEIRRILGTLITSGTLGEVDNNIFFGSIEGFSGVLPGDILTITSATDPDWIKDYRILENTGANSLRINTFFPDADSNISYEIRRTGIIDASMNLVQFDYNPMTIDVGDQVILDEYGRERGIRPGRENLTITDMAYLYTTVIELIDPVSLESLGESLEGKGGFGLGGYGRGGYGVGSRAQYRMIVNKPTNRFSAYEDSYIAIDTAFLGQSFRVNYKYVPEIVEFQTFANSDSERVLDAEVLMRHFLPGVVDITAEYTTDPTNASTPTLTEVTTAVERYINKTTKGQAIDASDIVDVIYEQIDPNRTRRAKVKSPITMYATIYNTDNTLTIVESTDSLEVPEEEIPSFTTAPLSPRIVHWIAGTITLTEIAGTSTGSI
jgi:hypothetical protein